MWTGRTRGLTRHGATDGALPLRFRSGARITTNAHAHAHTQSRKHRNKCIYSTGITKKKQNTVPTLPSSWVAWRLRAFFRRWLGNLMEVAAEKKDVGKVCHERHGYTPKQVNRFRSVFGASVQGGAGGAGVKKKKKK